MIAPERTEAEMAERIAAFEAAPAAPESRGARVLVTWRSCQCEWGSKFCDENHTRSGYLPAYILADFIEGPRP